MGAKERDLGHSEHSRQGELTFSKRWTVFGPISRYDALMLDPLTAAVCCPAEIKAMTRELFKAEKAFLPGFK